VADVGLVATGAWTVGFGGVVPAVAVVAPGEVAFEDGVEAGVDDRVEAGVDDGVVPAPPPLQAETSNISAMVEGANVAAKLLRI